MFSDPFDSFHNMVSEAKEERENLDRLLTISTPRERLLVAGIGLFGLIFAGWLFLGSVARTAAFDGVLIGPSERSLEDSPSVQALVWVEGGFAPRIAAGLPAVVELTLPSGEGSAVDGTIAAVAQAPLSEGLDAIAPKAPVSVHRVELSIDEGLDPAAIAGAACRIVIELGKQPPIALFGMRRS